MQLSGGFVDGEQVIVRTLTTPPSVVGVPSPAITANGGKYLVSSIPSGHYVVSFVNPSEDNDSRAQSFKDVDLKAFFTAAASYGIPSTMYLTDVFAGFEIWSGGSGGNLGVDEFKAVVNK